MSDWDTGRLIYLAVMGVMVVGWFFTQSRRNMNRTLQQAILWILLFGGIVGLYGLKDDLRLQVMPSTAAQRASEEAITLKRARDGHFYANLKINGQNVEFVVDTGATNMVLSRDDARKVGIDPASLAFIGTANTANGPVRTARTKAEKVEFGTRTDANVTVWVNKGEMFGSLLGMDYLRRFSSIEIAGTEMILRW